MKFKNKSTIASLICILLIALVSSATIGVLSVLGIKTNTKCSGLTSNISMIQAQLQSIDSTYLFTGELNNSTEQYLHVIDVGMAQIKQFYNLNNEKEKRVYQDLEAYTTKYISVIENNDKENFKDTRQNYLNILSENMQLAKEIAVTSSKRNETATTVGIIFLLILSTVSFTLVFCINKKQQEQELIIKKKNDTIESKNNIISGIVYSDIITELPNKYAMIENIETPSSTNNRVTGFIFLEDFIEIKSLYGFNTCDVLRTKVVKNLQNLEDYTFFFVDDETLGFIYNTKENVSLSVVNEIKSKIKNKINRTYFLEDISFVLLKSNVCISFVGKDEKVNFDKMYVNMLNERNRLNSMQMLNPSVLNSVNSINNRY